MKKQSKKKLKQVNKKLKRKSAGTNKGTSGMQRQALVDRFTLSEYLNG